MNEPCTLVIFGATGNLSRIKLLPALYQLERAARLAPQTRILGFGRRDWSDADWRREVMATLTERIGADLDPSVAERLGERLGFVNGDLEDASGFARLAERLAAPDLPPNRIFYLAIAPAHYGVVAQHLADQGLQSEAVRLVPPGGGEALRL